MSIACVPIRGLSMEQTRCGPDPPGTAKRVALPTARGRDFHGCGVGGGGDQGQAIPIRSPGMLAASVAAACLGLDAVRTTEPMARFPEVERAYVVATPLGGAANIRSHQVETQRQASLRIGPPRSAAPSKHWIAIPVHSSAIRRHTNKKPAPSAEGTGNWAGA